MIENKKIVPLTDLCRWKPFEGAYSRITGFFFPESDTESEITDSAYKKF